MIDGQHGRYLEARKQFESALDRDPMLGDALIGLAATWLLNRYFVHTEVADLWPFAVLVCFAMQRVAPPVLDALSEGLPALIRRWLGSKGQ